MSNMLNVGDTVEIVRNIPSADGMLHEGVKAKVNAIGFPDKDLRIIDEVGKIWYVNNEDVTICQT
jgi:hypothetical protein